VADSDPETYSVLVQAMDRHDAGAGRGGLGPTLARLADHGVRLTGLGIPGDLLYGPDQVRALVEAAAAEGAHARYLELRSTKGHDAFLVEWDQLTDVVRDVLAEALAPRPVPPTRPESPARQEEPTSGREPGARFERPGRLALSRDPSPAHDRDSRRTRTRSRADAGSREGRFAVDVEAAH